MFDNDSWNCGGLTIFDWDRNDDDQFNPFDITHYADQFEPTQYTIPYDPKNPGVTHANGNPQLTVFGTI